ncbi:MAG TPA: hypothetical protein VK724_23040 [Bryobacteraceae bacterium]|jgi:hypothetical protein|nr:hypothetical protein [Bryobacteraceae bacterium]
MRTIAVILCAAVCALLVGCGSIGEPLYPALKIPQRVTDLSVVERGPNLAFDFTINPRSTEGVLLEEIGGVELRAGPSPPNGFSQEEWLKSSTRIDVPTPDKPGPVHAELPAAQFIGHEILVAVRVTNPKGRDAGWSAFKTIQVEQPLAKPADFQVAASAKGVALSWRAAGITEYRIYRKSELQTRPVLLATATEQSYVDISAEYGKTYQYSIQGVRGTVETEMVGPETITPIDTFPPEVPTSLTASVGLGAVELAWARNTESDFKEYRVFRSDEGGPFVEIVRGLEAPTYSDHGIQSGKHYRYQVSAVDQLGNASAPSTPVEITAQ